MSVTPDLTLANIQALFNPANYDIIIRTLVMAIAVTLASAILAFPMAWYMARYTSGKWKAFFYIAVMLPMWARARRSITCSRQSPGASEQRPESAPAPDG